MRESVHIIVTGLVQGVGFRWFVCQTADTMEISGWVRNRPDGSVEIVAEGTPGSIRTLIEEVKRGPRHSSVGGVTVTPRECSGTFRKFSVKY